MNLPEMRFGPGATARRIGRIGSCRAQALSKGRGNAFFSLADWPQNAWLPRPIGQLVTAEQRMRAASFSRKKASPVEPDEAALGEIIKKAR